MHREILLVILTMRIDEISPLEQARKL